MLQAVIILQPLEFLVSSVLERDDAYYYFTIARNIAEDGRATFDGIHAANGVQFAWVFILVAVAWIFDGAVEYLRAILVLCLVLNIAVGLMLRQLGQVVHSPALGDLALLFWAGVLVERWNVLQGMETSLHILVILAICLLSWRIIVLRTRGLELALGLLLTLNYWTRLDSVIFSDAIWLIVVVSLYRQLPGFGAWLRSVAFLTLPPLIGAVLYMLTSYWMADTLLPLSGSVKAIYAERFFDGTSPARILIEQTGWWIKIQAMLGLSLVPASLVELGNAEVFNPLSRPHHLLIPLALGLVSLLGVWRIFARADLTRSFGRLVLAGAFLWAVSAGHAMISILAIADFSHVTRHYYSWLLVFWLYWGGILVLLALQAVPQKARRAAVTGAVALNTAAYAMLAYTFLNPRPGMESYALARLHVSETLTQQLPEDAIVGAWNAGALGYFLDRPVINLDGLVNDRAFRDFLRSGQPIDGYLAAEGITHLIDHNDRDLTMAYLDRRDPETSFRNSLAWQDVEVLTKIGSIHVIRLKPPAPPPTGPAPNMDVSVGRLIWLGEARPARP